MPVHLEHISQPTDQDWIDLGKIYTDAPQEWLSNSSDIKGSLQALLDNDYWLIAGRFNSRLLGAMQAKKDGSDITLSHFCVRNVTINRGVAHQMLHHISKWANENGYRLIAKGVPAELSNSLIKRNFTKKGDDFICNLE
ncbi:MAG: aspartate 1-decarboxylase autocleavage activator PanM [Oleispira sp.]|jgi:hypothetical protein|nr:aspartate 1-decarboxylase autocleavage activator PanM [Oleispira sp.]|tara:strand:- start:297 stop:713 length:417 start_codon:yes stop_codon:yes gene_type:complete